MPTLKLSFLGSPLFELDGQPLEISAGKSVALLAYLAVSGQIQSRDTLGTLLWPDKDQAQARTYLRHALWTLKKALGEQWLMAGREQIGLQFEEGIWLDVQEFNESISAVTQAPHSTAPLDQDSLNQLQDAVQLYRDNFLAGFTLPDSPAFDEWQFFQAEALRQTYAAALERLVQEYSAQQAYDAAISNARRRLALDQLHEPVHRTLMRLYALDGQQAAALRQYQECVRLLDEELGIEPEQETTSLYETIRSRKLGPPKTAVAPPPTKQPPSTERFLLKDLLDTGAHGEVYLGQDTQDDTPVIIKRLRSDAVGTDKNLVARFMQEVEALQKLNHPNIVCFLDQFEKDGRQHLVMEYVSAGTLAQRLAQAPPLSLTEFFKIALELADALTRAHHLNIIHRDIKPENVLLAADNTPRLIDFGLARLIKEDGGMTTAGTVLGSPAYMSPESLQGADADVRSDIWSFGVLLFEMLAGQRPFPEEQITAVMVSIINNPAPDIRQFRPDVPDDLADLLEALLVKKPENRLSSMRLVAARLELVRDNYLSGGSKSTSHPITRSDPLEASFSRLIGLIHPESGEDINLDDISSSMPTFVARDKELARLDTMLQSTLSGRPQIAFIHGEAGQGKTALLQAFARQAQESHTSLIVAGGNCNAFTGLGDPFLPFREILGLLTADLEAWPQSNLLQPAIGRRIARQLPATLQSLADNAPDLIDTFLPRASLRERVDALNLSHEAWYKRLFQQAENNSSNPNNALQQNALMEQYHRLVQAIARETPLLLIIDDLQWADPGSISLLFHLGRHLSNCQTFIIGAYRPNEVAMSQDDKPHPLLRVINELQRLYGDIFVDLDQAEGESFIEAWLDNEPNHLEKFFRQTLYRQTGGHPLFTIELLQAMQERGDLQQNADGVWEMNEMINWNTMPARVEGAISERISRLEPQLQELLQVASVEGDEFNAETAAKVLQLDERETVRLLSRDLNKVHALVQPVGSRHIGDRRLSYYHFRHILIQQYLYNSLDEFERIYQHEAVGNALEALYGPDVDSVALQLARHFELAQLPEKAAKYLHSAGDQARRTAALEEAIHHYQAALTYCLGDENMAEQAIILRKLGECQWILGRSMDALDTFENSYELFNDLNNIEQAGAIQRLIGRVYWEIGNREKSLHHYHLAISILEPLEDSIELAWAISSISQMHMLASETEEAILWGEKALTLARRLNADPVIVHALNNVGTSYLIEGQIETGQAMLQESIQKAVENNLIHDACRGYLNLGTNFTEYDQYEAGRKNLENLLDYASRVQVTLYIASSLIELANLDWITGRWRSALSRTDQIKTWLVKSEAMAYPEVIAKNLFSRQYNDLGQFEQALSTLQTTASQIIDFDEAQFSIPYQVEFILAQSTVGTEQEKIQSIFELQDIFDRFAQPPFFIPSSTLVILIALDENAIDEPDLVEDIIARLDDVRLDRHVTNVPSQQATWHQAWGMAQLLQNNLEQAVESLRQSVELWESVERPLDQARVLSKLGQVLAMTGKQDESYDAFKGANARIEGLAAQLDDDDTRNSFLQSPLVKEIRAGLN